MEKVPPSLVTSIISTLMSKIKCYIHYAKKNRLLAQRLLPFYSILCEQIVPQFVLTNLESYTVVNSLQRLVFLLSQKVHQTFQQSVIRGCLDQNLGLKALKQVTIRLLETLSVKEFDHFARIIDNQIQNQNFQSQLCITSFISYIRSPKKLLIEDDFTNLIETYETTLHFVLQDIDRHRRQKTPSSCFMTLFPWVYDIDLVDMQIILNNDLTAVICSYLKRDAQVFWLSNFKCQASVTSDEFFGAVREIFEIAHMTDSYNEQAYLFEQVATQNSVLSLREHSELISTLIRSVSRAVSCGTNLNILVCQIKLYQGRYQYSDLVGQLGELYVLNDIPDLDAFKRIVTGTKLVELSNSQINVKIDLTQTPFKLNSNKQTNDICLIATITQADTPCNKGITFSFDGSTGCFKFGEGDSSNYQLPNDKKIWESQLQFVCNKEGNYFVRDCGRLHPSRIRLDQHTSVQIQKGTVIDLGNCLQYHFDKVTQDLPIQKTQDSIVIRPKTKPEQPQGEDFPCLRARALWANKLSQQDQEKIQKELILESGDYQTFKLGRGSKNDISIKLSKLSNEHCSIKFKGSQGWSISECDNKKLSSSGTFVYLKSLSQIIEQEPSNLIQVFDGLVISFINYEIKLELKQLSAEQQQENSEGYVSLLGALAKKEALAKSSGLFKHLLSKQKAAQQSKQNTQILQKQSSQILLVNQSVTIEDQNQEKQLSENIKQEQVDLETKDQVITSLQNSQELSDIDKLLLEEQLQLEEEILTGSLQNDNEGGGLEKGNFDLSEIPSEDEDDEPVMILPNIDAIQADRACATRLMLIENTEHTTLVDEGDQYSLRQSICVSDTQSVRNSLRQSTVLLEEQKATAMVDNIKSKLAEMLRKKMEIHTLKAQEYSKLENMLTDGDVVSQEETPILIKEELEESESIAQLRVQLQEAELAQQIARQMTQSMQDGIKLQTSHANIQTGEVTVLRDESVQTSQQFKNIQKSGFSTNEKCNKVPSIQVFQIHSLTSNQSRVANLSLQNYESKYRFQQIGHSDSKIDENPKSLKKFMSPASGNNSRQLNENQQQTKSTKSWLDTDTLYSQKFLTNQNLKVVFPKEDEKHTNGESDSD